MFESLELEACNSRLDGSASFVINYLGDVAKSFHFSAPQHPPFWKEGIELNALSKFSSSSEMVMIDLCARLEGNRISLQPLIEPPQASVWSPSVVCCASCCQVWRLSGSLSPQSKHLHSCQDEERANAWLQRITEGFYYNRERKRIE